MTLALPLIGLAALLAMLASGRPKAKAIADEQSKAARDAWGDGAAELDKLKASAKAPAKKAPAKVAPSGPVITVTSPKIRESTDAEKAAALKAAQQAAAKERAAKTAKPRAPAEPTPQDYYAMYQASRPPSEGLTSTQPTPTAAAVSLPAGYDPKKARATAQSVASHLKAKGRDHYSRPLLKQWQRAAGLAVDGVYGGGTRGALLYYGASAPPQPFFKPTATAKYVPPEER